MGPTWGRQDPGGPHVLCYLGCFFYGHDRVIADFQSECLHPTICKKMLKSVRTNTGQLEAEDAGDTNDKRP